MMPLLMTTVMTLVPPHSRGRTMGDIPVVISVAPSLGAARAQNVSEPRKVPLDSLSVVLSAFAFGGLIYGLSSLGEAVSGSAVVTTWIPITAGGVALGMFILQQLALQRGDRALLDLRTFLSRGFTA